MRNSIARNRMDNSGMLKEAEQTESHVSTLGDNGDCGENKR